MSRPLEQVNTRYLLIWLPVVLVVGTLLFYALLSLHTHHMEEEQLELKQENIWNAFKLKSVPIESHIIGEYDLSKGISVPNDWLNNQRDTTIYYADNKEWVIFKILTQQHVLEGQIYQLTTYVSTKEITHLIIKVSIAETFIFILLLGGIVIINRKSSGLLWKPFYRTMEKIQGYDITRNKTIQLEARTGIAEFEQLN